MWVRAERRKLELIGKGETASRAGVLADVQARDSRDTSRDVAPMVAAKDAILLDTSGMRIEEAIRVAVIAIEKR